VRAALCPGSFDPVTNGHIDIVERAAVHFDEVLVAVTANPSKRPLFSVEERVEMLSRALAHVDNARVASFTGLLVDFAAERAVSVVVKGLRATSDLDHELQMAAMNAALRHGLDTMFLHASPRWSFVSSSLVKEVARLGGSVEAFVPQGVAGALAGRFAGSARREMEGPRS
jgi:pantetheine-phosphate adenylyltransferase